MPTCLGWGATGDEFIELPGQTVATCPGLVLDGVGRLASRASSSPTPYCVTDAGGGTWVGLPATPYPSCAFAVVNASDYRANPPIDEPSSSVDWTSTSVLLQALLVSIVVLFFVLGYRAGDKV